MYNSCHSKKNVYSDYYYDLHLNFNFLRMFIKISFYKIDNLITIK